jgi:hypothetical protein
MISHEIIPGLSIALLLLCFLSATFFFAPEIRLEKSLR